MRHHTLITLSDEEWLQVSVGEGPTGRTRAWSYRKVGRDTSSSTV